MWTRLADGAVFLAALLAAMELGGSFYEALVVYPAWSSSPPGSLALIQGPNSVDSAPFWIGIHLALEVALIAALALNWRAPRRRTLILVGLGVHLFVRVWTFLYFIPEIAQFMVISPEGSFSTELTTRVSLWGSLGWVRRALIAASGAVLLLALMTPAVADAREAFRECRQRRVA